MERGRERREEEGLVVVLTVGGRLEFTQKHRSSYSSLM